MYYVYMYRHHIYSKGKDQPGKVANPTRRQLNKQPIMQFEGRLLHRGWVRSAMNGEQKVRKYLFPEIFYGRQEVHKYFYNSVNINGRFR